MTEPKREQGFYWLMRKSGAAWIVAWWYAFDCCWYEVNDTDRHFDSEYSAIGQQAMRPVTAEDLIAAYQHKINAMVERGQVDNSKIEEICRRIVAEVIQEEFARLGRILAPKGF